MSSQKELPAEQLSHLVTNEFSGTLSPASIETVASLHVMIARLVDAISALAKLHSNSPEASKGALDQLGETVSALLTELSDNIKRLAKEKVDADEAR